MTAERLGSSIFEQAELFDSLARLAFLIFFVFNFNRSMQSDLATVFAQRAALGAKLELMTLGLRRLSFHEFECTTTSNRLGSETQLSE